MGSTVVMASIENDNETEEEVKAEAEELSTAAGDWKPWLDIVLIQE
jgi:hypothetical protein